MAVSKDIDIRAIGEQFNEKVTGRMADWFEAELKAKANTAGRRTRIIRSHGHSYTYSKYQNTWQLGRNIKQYDRGKGAKVVDAGRRSDYTGTGYHGMYFLVEKKGMQDVKTTLKKGANYANSMKL